MVNVYLPSVEYRCKSRLHAVRREYPDGKVLLEVRCKDQWCTDRRSGEIVLHYFDWHTGKYSHTKKFKDPHKSVEARSQKENNNNSNVSTER